MEWLTNIEDLKVERSVVSVGTFDGLHKGHLKVIGKTVQRAKEMKAVSIVFTFWPHPQEILFPDKSVYYLNTFQEKIERFEKAGIDYLILFPFTKDFSQLSYQKFIKEYLVDALKMKFFVIGYDHHFGKDRAGDFKKLLSYSKDYNFGVERIEQEIVTGEVASSTEIRNAINKGELSKANNLLGYFYFLSGKVKQGKGIGRTINSPTLNIELPVKKLIPKAAVYICLLQYNDKKYKAITNVGYNPTVDTNNELGIEVHILDFNEEIYGKEVKVYFLEKIREELRFDNLMDLQKQIEKDKVACIQYFKKQK